MSKVTLLLVFHNHQPVGNLDEVFKSATEDCYLPLVKTLREFPDLKFSLHFTGPLWNWLEKNDPEVIEITKEMVKSGQVEILGGGYYEPMLAVLPEHDAAGQLKMMKRRISDVYGVEAEGMWLAERVWEPDLAGVISDAGYKYTVLDDRHFHSAGLTGELDGYYVTEKAGKKIAVFPISQALRYAIPFLDPEKAVNEILRLGALKDYDDVVLTYGDDGEKFGVWPGTYDLVWNREWLKRFLSLLNNMTDEITLSTPSEVLKNKLAQGRIYLPTSSYEEMGEWTLVPDAQKSYKTLKKILKLDNKIFDAFSKRKNYAAFVFPVIESLRKIPAEWINTYNKLMDNGGNKIIHAGGLLASVLGKKSRFAKQTYFILDFIEKLTPALAGNNIFLSLVEELRDISAKLLEITESGIKTSELEAFIQGGIWQAFIAKYHETNLIHKRMIGVSERLQALKKNPVGTDAALLEKAEDELYQAQCNCAYWHGIFGGLYMVHLRHALYEHLILADKYMDRYEMKTPELSVYDFDADFADEAVYSSMDIFAVVKPSLGGGLLEFDVKPRNFNILNVMTRQREGYHSELLLDSEGKSVSEAASIHDLNNYVDQETLDKLVYDFGPRFSFQDTFTTVKHDPELFFREFRLRKFNASGDFTFGKYDISAKKDNILVLTRTGKLGEAEVKLDKTYVFSETSCEVKYSFELLKGEFSGNFISESAFTMLSDSAPDRKVIINGVEPEGENGLCGSLHNTKAETFGMVSYYDGIRLNLSWDKKAVLYVYPLESVSKSESGVETNYQGTAAAVLFELDLNETESKAEFSFVLSYEIFAPRHI